MSDQYRSKAAPESGQVFDVDKKEHHRDTGNDLGVQDRKIGHVHNQRFDPLAAQLIDPDRGCRTDDRSNRRSADRHRNRSPKRRHNRFVPEKLDIPPKGKAGKEGAGLGFVE